MRRDRLASGRAILRAIGRHPGNPAVDLIEQRRHQGRIDGVLIRQCLRHDPAGRGIDAGWITGNVTARRLTVV